MAILPSIPAKLPTTCSAASALSGCIIGDAPKALPIPPLQRHPFFSSFSFACLRVGSNPGPRCCTRPTRGPAQTRRRWRFCHRYPPSYQQLLPVVRQTTICAKPSVDVATVATFAASTFVSVDCTCKRARIFARNVSFCLASLGSNPIPRKKNRMMMMMKMMKVHHHPQNKKKYIYTFKRTTIFAIGIALVAALLEDFDDTAEERFVELKHRSRSRQTLLSSVSSFARALAFSISCL